MDDACEDTECMDDAEWSVVKKAPDGTVSEHQFCSEHLKPFVQSIKDTPGATISSIAPYDADDEDDESEEE